MEKYKMNNKMDLKGKFTKIPNNAFYLSATEFKLYCWLLKHDDGYMFGKMFMVNGSGLRNITIEKILPKLIKKGLIKVVNNDIIIVTNDSQK